MKSTLLGALLFLLTPSLTQADMLMNRLATTIVELLTSGTQADIKVLIRYIEASPIELVDALKTNRAEILVFQKNPEKCHHLVDIMVAAHSRAIGKDDVAMIDEVVLRTFDFHLAEDTVSLELLESLVHAVKKRVLMGSLEERIAVYALQNYDTFLNIGLLRQPEYSQILQDIQRIMREGRP